METDLGKRGSADLQYDQRNVTPQNGREYGRKSRGIEGTRAAIIALQESVGQSMIGKTGSFAYNPIVQTVCAQQLQEVSFSERIGSPDAEVRAKKRMT